MSTEKCTYCAAYDTTTLAPIGPECGLPAVELIEWKDGRTSAACAEHGTKALWKDGKKLVERVIKI